MEKFIMHKSLPLRFASEGDKLNNGTAIVLLHGYLETLEVWSEFAKSLAKLHFTVSVDLLGHGLSGSNPNENSMEQMSDAVHEVCKHLNLNKVLLVGHSMGGYVALAFAKKYEALTAAVCLFHSTPHADSDEKRLQRDREIEILRQGKKELLAQQSIPLMFAKENRSNAYEAIADIEMGALLADDEGTIACLQGMKNREDMNAFLRQFTKPLLMIFGANDQHISPEVSEKLQADFPQAQCLILENSGHIGFIEEAEKAAESLVAFASKSLN
ncbi:MAG: alpha/beta fold hydrolase [Bacteroidales bacterium]